MTLTANLPTYLSAEVRRTIVRMMENKKFGGELKDIRRFGVVNKGNPLIIREGKLSYHLAV